MRHLDKTNQQKKAARMVSLLVFILMTVVSTVIFFSGNPLKGFDYFLVLVSPVALSAFCYFVVLHHDPEASD
jgi:4-amino-4-deoxy-L-arabinose transferase-like glycosyltransferase